MRSREQDLVHRARQGDQSAFESLVDRYQSRVYGLALRILGKTQDAEDVVQQTFLSLIEHLESFRGESSVMTWIFRIATNHALKILRKRRGLPTISLNLGTESDDGYSNLPHPDFIAQWRENPQALAERSEVMQLLNDALEQLDDRYRVVFALRDIEGLSVRETADVLGITESNVKVRLLRARLQLRERLTRALGDESTQVIPNHSHD